MNEELAALYVADVLTQAGIASEHLEPAPGRVSIVSRTPGSDSTLPPLLLHAHLDTVPAQPEGWIHDPFGAEIVDGELWGRGAVDMKVAAAMLLRLQLDCRAQRRPRRDLVVAYLADEEMGGTFGSRWIVENRLDLLAAAKEALGEIGGFNIDLPNGKRVFFVQTAERGMLWVRIVIRGPGGHAAFSANGNPIASAALLIAALGDLTVGEEVLKTTDELEHGLASLLAEDAGDIPLASRVKDLGSAGSLVQQGRRTQFVPTMVSGGEKLNMIPSSVELFVDCRFLPGSRDRALEAIRGVVPGGALVEVVAESEGLQSPTTGPTFEELSSTITRFHPNTTVLPFVFPCGSDAQKFARAGVTGYGFMPLVLPSGFPYLQLFHAVNERVPVDAIAAGYAMLRDFVMYH